MTKKENRRKAIMWWKQQTWTEQLSLLRKHYTNPSIETPSNNTIIHIYNLEHKKMTK